MLDILAVTDRYCQTMDWKKITLFKICTVSFGLALGTAVSEKHKKSVFFGSMCLFLLTYVPLMFGFFQSMALEDEEMYL